MSGGTLKLTEMEASDMLDVLHFLYEEDFTATSEEHARSRSGLRDAMYRDLYGVDYPFKMKDRPKSGTAGGNVTDVQHVTDYDDLGDVKPFDPKKGSDPFNSPRDPTQQQKSKVKFIDASKVPVQEHFSSALDAPLG